MSKALLKNNMVTDRYWMGPIGQLASAVIDRAIADYQKGTPQEKMDAYKFLIEEDCGIWRHFVDLPPSWKKAIVPPEEQIGLTDDEKREAVELYRKGMIAIKGLSVKFRCPYGLMSSFIKGAIPAAEMKQIEETRKHRQFKGVVKDRLSGVSTHNAAMFNHVAHWKVLEWFKTFMIQKGVMGKDYINFLQELSKKGRGSVAQQCDEWIKELG